MADGRGKVLPGVERDVAQVLGATAQQADSLVAMLAAADLLAHGVVVIGAVAAARWGIELQDAVVAMGDGRGVPEGISQYELRTAAEEGEADIEEAWAAAMRAGQQDHAVWRRLRTSGRDVTDSDILRGAGDGVPASTFAVDVAAVLRS